jgi:hypothetical protein
MPRPKGQASKQLLETKQQSKEGLENVAPVNAVEVVNAQDDDKQSPEDVLKEYKLWEGWAATHRVIPLGPNHELRLRPKEELDPEVVGFAMPLPAVEYALRNERKYPPPSESDCQAEMFKLIQHTLKMKILRRSYTMSIIYNHICRNKRDSNNWQKGFIHAKGVEMFMEIWKDPEPPEGTRTMGDRYWIVAIIGRMLGTSQDSRKTLIDMGVVDLIIEGTRDEDKNVRDNSVMALKGLIQYPEGRVAVSYDKLIDCLSRR